MPGMSVDTVPIGAMRPLSDTELIEARRDACMLLAVLVDRLAAATLHRVGMYPTVHSSVALRDTLERLTAAYRGLARDPYLDDRSAQHTRATLAGTVSSMLDDQLEPDCDLRGDRLLLAWGAVLYAEALSSATPEWLLTQLAYVLSRANVSGLDPLTRLLGRRSVVLLHGSVDPSRSGPLVSHLHAPGRPSEIFNATLLAWFDACRRQAARLGD